MNPVGSTLLPTWLKQCWDGVLHLIYPPVCAFCGQAIDDSKGFCASCRHELMDDPFPSCPRCGTTIGPHTDLDDGCPSCRDQRFRFASVTRMGPYAGKLRDAILALKYAGGEPLAESLAQLMVEALVDRLRPRGIDFVVPVPLHWIRRFQRGYNQSQTLAAGLAKGLGVPCRARWLRRTRHTPFQTVLSATARHANVQKAFVAAARKELVGKTVLIVDDVLTTGNTCNACARVLQHAGAREVHVAVLAHSQS